MATIDLGDLTFLTLRADMGTPPEHVQFDGLRLTIPSSVTLPQLGEYSTLAASGVTVYGFTRAGLDGLEWQMTAPQDPDLAMVDAVPGPAGWADEGARQGYLQQAKYLKGQGITAAVLWPGLTNFYNWTAADLAAKGWTPGES